MKTSLLGAIAGPGSGQLKADSVAHRGRHQRAAPAGAVRGKPRLEVLGVAEVVPRVAVGAIEMQQVLGRGFRYAEPLVKSSQTAMMPPV